MSTYLHSTQEAKRPAPAFRGRPIEKSTTTDELAKICLETTGESITTREAVQLVRSGVEIKLSPEDEQYLARRTAAFCAPIP